MKFLRKCNFLGINLNRFPVFSVNLERFIELITFTNKIASESEIKHQANKATIDVNTLSSKEELLEAIRNQDFRIFPEEANVLNKILKESIEKERQLNEQFNEQVSLGRIKNIKRFVCPTEKNFVLVKKIKILKEKVIYSGYLYFESENKLWQIILLV